MPENENTIDNEITTVNSPDVNKDNDNLTNDEMVEFMHAYAERIKREDRKRYMDQIDHILDTCGTLPKFSLFAHHSRNYSTTVQCAVASYFANENNVEQVNEYLFSGQYVHYGFIRSNMRSLLTKYEGHACCMDKCSTVMILLQRSILEGDTFTLPEPGEWYLPTRRIDLWVNMVIGLIRLAAGENDVYLRTLVDLESAYAEVR